jgi:poly-beta-1,6-N-acetyl-D-glucosamine synthase
MKKVTVILPCHNEEKILKSSIESLLKQTYWDIEIIVVLDNCIDKSEEIANSFDEQVKVFKSIDNKHKKAGALNQLFNCYINYMGEYILVMDADTVLDKKAIFEGVRFLNKNENHAAVCSIAGVLEPENKNLLWYLQKIEYGFGDTSFIENKDNVYVCRGMYSMYRKYSLQKIHDERNFVYDINSITEDYELTLKLKSYGYKISNCTKIKAYTDVPTKLKDFFIQRKRWIKGGVDDLRKYGYKKYTARDINCLAFYILLIILQVYFLSEAIIVRNVNLYWLSAIVFLYYLNAFTRLKYVRNKDFKTYVIVYSIFPMMAYSIFDSFTTIYSTILSFTKKQINWR